MTMFSGEQQRFYGDFCVRNYYEQVCIGSNLVAMADENSRSESVNEGGESTREENYDQSWLQLSIGGGRSRADREPNSGNDGAGLVELELLPNTSNLMLHNINTHDPEMRMREFGAPFLLHNTGRTSGSSFPHQLQEINWGFIRPISNNLPLFETASDSFLTSSTPHFPATYYSRPFQVVDTAAPVGPSLEFRVIPPPRRQHSGIWFMLQPSKHQEKEPFLPQLSKSYLRIKDGSMTIRLVMKYLVKKLTLEDESEIEIKCRGQKLVPHLTLQHVRDNIWSTSRDSYITFLPHSSTTDHFMVLNYGRIDSSN